MTTRPCVLLISLLAPALFPGVAFGAPRQGSDASVAQYEPGGGGIEGAEDDPGDAAVLVAPTHNTDPRPTPPQRDESDRTKGINEVPRPTVVPDLQPARQLEVVKQHPLTGFAVLPILLAGLALIAVGLVLRSRLAGRPDRGMFED